MSLEICIFSDQQLESMSDWQKAIDAESLPLQLSENESFAELNGFLPASLHGKKTGFECHHVEPREMIQTYEEDIKFGRQWKYALVLVWGGDFSEMQAAWMAATAYARAISGVVFDPQAGQLLTAAQALEMVNENKRAVSQLE